MWTRADLKYNAKIAFRRNYWTCVAVSFIVMIVTGQLGGSAGAKYTSEHPEIWQNRYYENQFYGMFSMIFVLLSVIIFLVIVCFGILIGNVVRVGHARYYLENRGHQTKASELFFGFQGGRYGNIVFTMFVRNFYIFLWSLLFVIPGVIKSYAYQMVPYILAENPTMDRRSVLELSEEMMRGHKMEAFVLDLSFIGWMLLSGLTCGILNIFYVRPYMDATYTEFYEAIKGTGEI